VDSQLTAGTRQLSVSELIRLVNFELGARFSTVAVEGEISQLTRAQSGHTYFTIKDDRSQLRVVLFSMYARQLKFEMETGLQVIVRGTLEVYRERGEFQLKALTVEPAGIGALQLAFEQLKEKLSKEGLFDPERKRPIPMLPERIAIVTSPTGAAIRDILNVISRRFSGLSIQIYPVRVQGTGSARQIATAIDDLSRWNQHDVVVLSRGGGSPEDLWSFNEEIVARAIANSGIPIITGIGHEIDFTIADFVADLRAATPSAAAEIVVQARADLQLRVRHAEHRIRRIVEGRVTDISHSLRHLSSADGLGRFTGRVSALRNRANTSRNRLYQRLERAASVLRRRLNAAEAPLMSVPARLGLGDRKRRVDATRDRVRLAMRNHLREKRGDFDAAVARLDAVSPLSVLARGFAIAFSEKDGRELITDSAQVGLGDPISVQLRRGMIRATVDEKTLGLETLWPDTEDHGKTD